MSAPQIIDHGTGQGHPEVILQNRRRRFGVWLKRAAWIICIAIILFIGTQYVGAGRYDAQVQVINEERIGVNPTDKVLDFGDLPRNKTASRDINLNNNGSLGSYIYVWKRGEIADLIQTSRNNFVLAPGSREVLGLSVTIPESAEYRYYKGKVVVFKIPKVW